MKTLLTIFFSILLGAGVVYACTDHSFEWFDPKRGWDADYVADYIKRHGIKGSSALVDCTQAVCWNIGPASTDGAGKYFTGQLEFPVYPYEK